jgi:hypothetical protein
MRVVLFCRGMVTRLHENSETIPKPLVNRAEPLTAMGLDAGPTQNQAVSRAHGAPAGTASVGDL